MGTNASYDTYTKQFEIQPNFIFYRIGRYLLGESQAKWGT